LVLNSTLESQQQRQSCARTSPGWLAELAWTLPFLILYWIDLAHHQFWRDELNAWTIARVSPNLPALLRLVHYEAHPWLWYVLLWVPSRFTDAPAAMKWVEGCIGTAAYLVIGLKSPFTRVEKLLIFLGYFIVFEYTVMSRMYSVMLLCALLYAWRRVERPEGVVGIAAILAVMGSSDMTGILLSAAMLLAYAAECWSWRDRWAELGLSWRRFAAAALLYLAAVGVAVYTLIPAPDISWSSGKMFAHALLPKYMARSVVNMIAAPWWPIAVDFPHQFWDTDLKDQHLLAFLAPVVLWAYWRTLRRDRNGLLMVGLSLGFGILFADLVFLGRVRHWGISLTAFLVVLWRMRAKLNGSAGAEAGRRLPASAYALLSLSAVAGLTAVVGSWLHPFSQAGNVAEWLRENHLADRALVGNPDVSLAPVAEQLRRPVYFMECTCVERFKLFSRDRDTFLEQELADRLVRAEKDLKTDTLIYICYRPLLADFDMPRLARRSLRATEIASFPGADVTLESYYIYRIDKLHAAGSAHD
jgi:hypothetical protein